MGMDKSGWRNWVAEVDPIEQEGLLAAILRDSKTLKAINDAIIRCDEVEGLNWSAMYLWADEVSLAEPQDKTS